jgi:hypothetical protein
MNKEEALKMVKKNGLMVTQVNYAILDRDICLAAVKQTKEAFILIPYAFQTKKMCAIVLSQSGILLEHVRDDLFDNNLIYIAVTQDGMAIQWVPKKLQTNRLKLIAVRNNGLALQHIVDQTDCVCLTAVKQDIAAMCYIRSIFIYDALHRYFVENMIFDEGQAVDFESRRSNWLLCIATKDGEHQMYDVDLKQFSKMLEYRQEINKCDITDINVFYGDVKLDISSEKTDMFKHTGMQNMNYLTELYQESLVSEFTRVNP